MKLIIKKLINNLIIDQFIIINVCSFIIINSIMHRHSRYIRSSCSRNDPEPEDNRCPRDKQYQCSRNKVTKSRNEPEPKNNQCSRNKDTCSNTRSLLYYRDNDLLLQYIKDENIEKIKNIINSCDVNYNKGRPLSLSIEKNNLEITDLLLKNGADINASEALATAILNENEKAMRYLIENGASTRRLNSCLFSLMLERNADFIKFLINHGVDIYYKYCYFLLRYVECEDLDMIAFLLEKGAFITDDLILEIIKNNQLSIIKFLIKKGFWDLHALIVSVEHKKVEIIDYLLPLFDECELKKALGRPVFQKNMLNYVLGQDLVKYPVLIQIFREFGIDIFDIIENEQYQQ